MAVPQPGIFAQGTRSHHHLEFDIRADASEADRLHHTRQRLVLLCAVARRTRRDPSQRLTPPRYHSQRNRSHLELPVRDLEEEVAFAVFGRE